MNSQLQLLNFLQTPYQGDFLELCAVINKLQHTQTTPPALRFEDDVDSTGASLIGSGPDLNPTHISGFTNSETYSHLDSCPSPQSPYSPMSSPLPPLSCVAHSLSPELDAASPLPFRGSEESVPVCYDFVQGRCVRNNCKYLHDSQKIEKTHSSKRGICFDYLRGDCNRGAMCRFSHDVCSFAKDYKIEDDISLAKVKRWGQGICFDFVRGACCRGDACPWSHNLLEIAVATKRGIENMETSERNRIAETVRRRLTASVENKCEQSHDHPHEMTSLPTPTSESVTTDLSNWVSLWNYPANVFGPLDNLGRPLHWFSDANAHLMQM